MPDNRHVDKLIIIISILFLTLSACILNPVNQPIVTIIADDVPMDKFIIGRWASDDIYRYDGYKGDYQYEFEFIKPNTVKFIKLDSDGYLLDGWTDSYYFIDDNNIQVKGSRGIDYKIRFEREGQKLVVYRTFEILLDKITLIRIEHKWFWQIF